MGKFISIGGKFSGVEQYAKKNGVISYYIKYKDLYKKTVREKVGDSPEMNKTKARDLLHKKKAELNDKRSEIKNGIHPRFYVPKAIRKNSLMMTIDDLSKIYLLKKEGTKDFFNIKSKYTIHIKTHPIASKPIVLITQEEISQFIIDKENTYVVKNGMQRRRKPRPTRDKSGIIEYIETEEEHSKRQYTLSPSTVNSIYGIIVSIVNYAIEKEFYTGRNPFYGEHRLETNNIRLKYLNNEETALFLQKLKLQSEKFQSRDKYVYLIGLLAITTGARRKTILSIKVGDINFEQGKISLCNFKAKEREYTATIATDEIKDLLKKFSFGKEADDYIFSSSRLEKQISKFPAVMKEILDTTVNQYRKKDNRMTLRDLRNSLASNLAIAGVPLLHIREVLDHKSITSTARYAQLMPGVATAAIKEYIQGIKIN